MASFLVSICCLLSLGSAESLGPKPQTPVLRIASLAPSLTQAVVFLGAEDKLVAISRFDEQPSLSHLPRAGGFSDVAIETLLKLRPGLLLVQKAPGNEAAIRLLAAQGIPVLAFSLTTIEDVCQAMAQLGGLLEASGKAQEWLSSFEALRQQLKAPPPPRRPRVLVLIGLSPTMGAGPGSFVDELVGEAGGQNILPRSPTPYPVVSLETVLHQKPDMVINLAEIHEGRSQLQKLPGFREARWVDAPNKDLLQPGPALLSALRQLASWFRNPPLDKNLGK